MRPKRGHGFAEQAVFSSSSAMTYQVANHADRDGVLLMQFEPGSAHDGYENSGFAGVPAGSGQASGRSRGRPLLCGRDVSCGGGHWICPAGAQDKDRPAGAPNRICYGEEASSCQ